MNGTTWGAKAGGMFLFAALGLGALAACGPSNAGSGPSNTPATAAGGPIKSMPAYPPKDDGAKAAKPQEDTAKKPADLKSICASRKQASGSFTLPGDKADRLASFASSPKSDDKAKGYSMADLNALAKKGAWEELIEHADDVAPAQRDAGWEKVVESAAAGYLELIATRSFDSVFTSQALARRYPHLAKSTAFMAKRGEAGKKAAEDCLREAWRGDHCIKMMNEFLATPGTSPEVGFAFGKITRLHQNHYVAVPFFKWALEKKHDAGMCADEDLRLAVVAGLGLPPDYENAAGARKITTDLCWDALKPAVEKAVLEEGGGYTADNGCSVLKAKGAL